MRDREITLRWGKNTRLENKKFAKTQLIMAAYKNFAEKGMGNTSISDITDTAKVSRGTFYKYFKNKKAIQYQVIEEIAKEFFIELASFAKRGAQSPVKLIEDLIVFTVEYNCFSSNGGMKKTNYEHDLFCLIPFVLEDKWKEGWREVLYRALVSLSSEEQETINLDSMAEVAGLLGLGCRQFKVKAQNIRNSSKAFQIYSIAQESQNITA